MIMQLKKANSYRVSELCNAFGLPLSSYYYQPVDVMQKESCVISKIQCISAESKFTYGKRRINRLLRDDGFIIGIYKTKKLMNLANIKVITIKQKHIYLDCGSEHKYAANLLNREFTPPVSNKSWTGDITYIKTQQGWSYLATVMDLYSRKIIGYAIAKSANAKLTNSALDYAVQSNNHTSNLKHINLMFHSDQGCQYSAIEFRNKLKALNITQSMSRRGNCWDNAVQERFFRSMKYEYLNHINIKNHDDAIKHIEQYIHFYNYKRRHSAICYLTPHQKQNEI